MSNTVADLRPGDMLAQGGQGHLVVSTERRGDYVACQMLTAVKAYVNGGYGFEVKDYWLTLPAGQLLQGGA